MRNEQMVAIVTGGGKGLGAAISRRLAADGWHAVVNDVDAPAAASVVASIREEGGRADAALADVTDAEAVASLVAGTESDIGPIGAVVFNATGPQPNRSLDDTGWTEIGDELDFFVKSPVLLGRAVLPAMRARRSGRLVHIDSEVVTKVPAHRSAYATAKAAQVGLMRSTALEVADDGITVNSVAPGFVPVERHADVGDDHREAYRRSVPMGHLGTAQDVAAAVAFFLSDDARFVTGQRLVVDGGRHLG